MLKKNRAASVIGLAAVASLTLAACAEGPTLQGEGATSQQRAMDLFATKFEETGSTLSYNASGSGSGQTQFIAGTVAFAGSDSPLKEKDGKDQVAEAKKRCDGNEAWHLPMVIGPVAVAYNLEGVDVALTPALVAEIFDGKITKWNDDAIKQQNPKVDLPDLDITVVHRSDKSGTTKNFLSYVKDAAGDAWSYELGENWPNEVGQGAKGTSGVISTVQQADGTIGYADASQAGELGTVAVKVGDDYVPFSAEAAAKVVDASPLDESATGDNRVVVKLDHNTTEAGAYPIVLVSYDIACPAYKDADTAKFVKSWLTYVVSDEGQQTAASAAGSAPLSDTMRQKVLKSIDAIETK